MIRNFYVCKIVHSQNGRSWGWIVYIFSMCNVRKAQKIKKSYHIISQQRDKKDQIKMERNVLISKDKSVKIGIR